MRFPDWLFDAIYYSYPVWTVLLAYLTVPYLVARWAFGATGGRCELRLA